MIESLAMKKQILSRWGSLSTLILLAFAFTGYAASQSNQAAAPVAQGPQPIGQVVWVKGVVNALEPNQKPRALQRRSPIFEQDTITTDKTSTGEIVFSDNSLMTFSTDSTVKIDSYAYGKSVPKGQSKFVASVVKGGFRTISGLIPKDNPDNYKVNTPVATIAIEGTAYAVSYRGQLYVKYFAGRPCVKNEKGTICLSDATPLASVGSASSAPVFITAAPGVFDAQPDVTPASFSETTTGTDGAVGGSTGTTKGPVGGFCITN